MKTLKAWVELVLAWCLLWALLFGVNSDGTHYTLSCTEARGVEIKHWAAP